jgi:hypothetical protein
LTDELSKHPPEKYEPSTDENPDRQKSLLYKESPSAKNPPTQMVPSEEAGHDIGFEKALLDWIVRPVCWRAQRQNHMPR